MRRFRRYPPATMYRGIAAAVALLVFAPSAFAKDVVKHDTGQSRDEVAAYWTDKRMREAIPAERSSTATPKAGKGGGGGGFLAYEANPYPIQHGKVFFTDSGVNYVCSGTALTSGNESVVWTAGHCVHDGPGSFHTNFAFVPAYRDNVRPYGTWSAKTLYTTSGWQLSGNFAYDLGAAVMNTSGGATLTDTVGGRPVAFNQTDAALASYKYFVHGYPAAGKFNGQRMRICETSLSRRDTSVSPATLGVGCDQTGGSSGGGWVVGGAVVSVVSYGYQSLKNVLFGPYQGSVAQSLFNEAAAG